MQTNNIIPFLFEETTIRVIMLDNEPWFIAKDISEALGYSDTFEMTKRLDEDDRQNRQIAGFGNRGITLINESGLYAAILGCQKSEAKRFQKWVTSEVLPSIRKTGSYNSKAALENSQKTTRLINLQQQSWKLMNAVKAETEPEVRTFLYEQLEAIAQEMGLKPPLMENLIIKVPDVPPEVTQFWAIYDALTTMGVEINHTIKPGIIAVNLSEFV